MSQALNKTNNELILKRRKRKKIKKLFMLFIMLVSLFAILCLKLSFFNIKIIQVNGSKNISDKDIVNLSNISIGNNIFYIHTNSSINNILSNPYIYSASIKKRLPSTVIIDVKERNAVFYTKYDDKYLIIDKDGIVLQKKDDIKNMKLVRLDGFDYSKVEIGKPIKDDDKRKIDAVTVIGSIIPNSTAVSGMTSVDVTSSIDIKLYFGDMYIRLGDAANIEKKINKAVNILQRKELQGAKGYIDVSFDGNPVFFIQK
ncbi:cell division protein FtsQ/DivIB [Clostridium sp. DJ247]|uniref:cell division protein FtsQ/DivIB n=1 Tax=Clostridium sp. DJ247 TaxID=2726188 RepID=UPI001626F502|nr:FtsQ-type POTRA domain-containing protein [Clostridium sp. DJ247]MBC2580651.1 FtsQ-type POTRA domain-containing protein [Clostridium sp. DJ247]MBC2580698.1 FtsQ-type POTRA domain-containing protein [Clostridium sp. DJ247]